MNNYLESLINFWFYNYDQIKLIPDEALKEFPPRFCSFYINNIFIYLNSINNYDNVIAALIPAKPLPTIIQ